MQLDKSEQTIADVLAQVITLLEGGWSREHTAATEKGAVCPFDAPEAKQFSLAGALWRAEIDCGVDLKNRGQATQLLRRELIRRKLGGVVRFNQNAAKGDVVVKRVKEIHSAFINTCTKRRQVEEEAW